MTTRLRITLYVIAAYMVSFGMLFMFAPGVAERITESRLPDPTLNLLYGLYALILGCVAFMAARENETATKLSLTVLMTTAGHVAVFGYLLLSGTRSFPQVAVPLVVNLTLTALLVLFRR